MIRLNGKVALVTGSTQGLGLGIAEALAMAGCTVIANGRSAARSGKVMDSLAAIGGEHAFVAADVSVEDEARALVDEVAARFGRFDILVNNAQFIPPGAHSEDPRRTADFGLTMGSGLYASLWTAQAVLPFMRAAGGGRIVNFGSINAVFGAKYGADYNATKEAIRGLTKTLANEWGAHGVTVNMILPAGISPAFEAFFEKYPERGEAVRKSHPMRRHGRAREDIGGAVVALCSDHARYVTGNAIFVDGGASLLGLAQFNTVEEPA